MIRVVEAIGKSMGSKIVQDGDEIGYRTMEEEIQEKEMLMEYGLEEGRNLSFYRLFRHSPAHVIDISTLFASNLLEDKCLMHS